MRSSIHSISVPCRGQAMTEFVISVGFIFMGLFVLIPTFGKIMDLQYTNQMASRYLAWERTVWLDGVDGSDDNEEDFVESTDEFESVATRSDLEIMNTLNNRFFYGQGRAQIKYINSSDADGAVGDESPLWDYVQSKNTMYQDSVMLDGSRNLDEKDTPSIAYAMLGVTQDVLGVVQEPLSDFLDFGGNDNTDLLDYDYNLKGYYKPELTTRLNKGNSQGGGSGVWDRDASGNWGSGIEDAIFSNPKWDGTFVARSAILADGWNAQSTGYYQDRADNMVLSSVFDFGFVDTILDFVGILEGGNPDNSPIANLEFGAVGIEPMPVKPDSDGEPADVDTGNDGFYQFDE